MSAPKRQGGCCRGMCGGELKEARLVSSLPAVQQDASISRAAALLRSQPSNQTHVAAKSCNCPNARGSGRQLASPPLPFAITLRTCAQPVLSFCEGQT